MLLALGLCYASYFILIAYSDFHRPQELGITLTYPSGEVHVAAVEEGSPGARAGVQAGDRITRIGPVPLATLRDRFSFHSRLPFDQPIPLGWMRDGVEMSAAVTLPVGERQFWGTRAGLTLLLMRGAQLLMLGLAFVIVWKQSENAGALMGAWLLASLSVYSIVMPPRLSGIWRELPWLFEAALWIPYLSSTSVGAVLATFYTVFPEKALRWRTILGWIWGVAIPLAALSAYDRLQVMYSPHEPPLPWALTAVSIYGNLLFVGVGAVIMLRNYRRLSSETERRRVRLVLTSSSAACLSGAIAVAHYAVSGTADLAGGVFASRTVTVGMLPGILIPFSFGYAILRHRLFDVSLLLRRGLQYALARRVLLSLVPAAVFVLALDIYAQIREPAGLREGRLWWYAVLLAGAAWAYRRRDQWLDTLDRRYFREQYSAQRLLRELAEDLQSTSQIEALLPAVARRIEAALHPRYVALLVRSHDGRFYQSPERSETAQSALRFSAGDKVIRLLAVLGRPLIVGPSAPHTVFDQLPEDEQQAVESLATELLVPITGPGDTTEALLAFGMKRSEEPFSSEDLDLLGAIAMNLRAALPRSATTEECDTCGASYATGTGRCSEDGAVLVGSMTPPVLADRYAIERRLGRGGMGVVYAARDLQLNRRIAVKLLERIEAVRDAERLRREARAAATLTHPNVVTIHDIGLTPDGRPFLVMELLRGATLRRALSSGPLDRSAIEPIVVGICAALDAAHAEGLVHRDLKPENVLLLNDGAQAGGIKLLDFGISLFLNDRGTPARSGVLGTPEYAAPEQIRGEPPAPAWDLWALAVIAFEALVGARPVACVATALWSTRAAQLTTWDALALERLSPPLADFFGRALSIDPACRPRTASQFLREYRESCKADG